MADLSTLVAELRARVRQDKAFVHDEDQLAAFTTLADALEQMQRERDEARATEQKNHAYLVGEGSALRARIATLEAAQSAARLAGIRLGLEEAARTCDSTIADSDGSAFEDGVSLGRDRCAELIRRLDAEAIAKETGK